METFTAKQLDRLMSKAHGNGPLSNAERVIAAYTLTEAGYPRETCVHCGIYAHCDADDAATFAAEHADCARYARLCAKDFRHGDRVTWESAYVVYFGTVDLVPAGRDTLVVLSDNGDRRQDVSRADLTSCDVDDAR